MREEVLSLIAVNRDAIATNRGFYYQYLHVVHKWVKNYVNENPVDVLTEVDDDIKEVGGELIFTQLKCYASAFSFSSPEIKKALLNFYFLYLKYHGNGPELRFNFTTNSAPAKREKLLQNWIAQQPPQTALLEECTAHVSKLLLKEIKQIRDKRLSNEKLDSGTKVTLTKNFAELNTLIADNKTLSDFVRRIGWAFAEETPEQSVKSLFIKITEELSHPKFGSRPVKLIMEAMLTEIYRRSQLADTDQRKVTNGDLQILLNTKDEELNAFIDNRLISILNVRFDLIESSLNEVKETVSEIANTQKQHGELIDNLIGQNAGKTHQIPRLLTLAPFIDDASIVGRQNKLPQIHQLLSEAHHVTINGNGGMGKSTMLKYYYKTYEQEYHHLIWLNAESGLVDNICLNLEIADALALPIESEKYTERFSLILARLKNIPGNNLLIVDGYGQPVAQLDEIRALTNWKILVGTRLRLTGWRTIIMDALSFDEAKELFTAIDDHNEVSEEDLTKFLEAVEYNTLTIGLVAKTISNSLDLTLTKVLEYFEKQDLDNLELQLDLDDKYGGSARLVNILKATFDLSALDDQERFFLLFFSILSLPVKETDIIDLVELFGKGKEAENKKEITNAINKLHKKGLIERYGKQFIMHKMLQQSILYQERQYVNSFVTQVMIIIELTKRFQEGSDHDTNQALRFLKYGEAVLENIKEPFRRSVYQPILKLENEVLNIYNWLNTEDDLFVRYESLYNRAKVALPANDSLTGIIANNLGLATVNHGDLDKAMLFFDDAIHILETQNEKALPALLTSLCNLCHLFIKRGEMTRFSECFAKIQEIRHKHKVWEDTSLPVQASVLGVANQHYGNLEKALEMFNFAINLHLELPENKRSDLLLVGYLINAAECYLGMKEFDKAEKAIIYATNVLTKINARDTIYFGELIKLFLFVCEAKGEKEHAEKLRQSLRNLGYTDAD